MTQKNIIAVFGGSFNPPTIAHINLAKQIISNFNKIEKVMFVPVSSKYNKNGLAPDNIRLDMLKKICEVNNNFEVSSIELNSERQLFTIETLKLIRNQNPKKEIYFILGTDNLKELKTWHKYEEILNTFKILVLERDNDKMEIIIKNTEALKQYENSFIKLKNINKIDMSSSCIRKRIKEKKSIEGMVPEEIKEQVKIIYKN